MLKKTTVLIILSLLIIAPIIGEVLPLIETLFPLGGAFHVPWDAPPFAESLLPLIGLSSMVLGGIGLFLYLVTGGKVKGGIKAYCYMMIYYSVIAFSIWLFFFGSRYVRYFLDVYLDIGFYVFWFAMCIPHIIWFLFLRYALKTIKTVPLIEPENDPDAEAYDTIN